METIAAMFIMIFSFGFMAFFMLLYFVIFIFAIFGIVFWIMMLIDVVKRDFEKENDKTTWMLVVALAGWIGGLIYYFSVKRPADIKAHGKPSLLPIKD